MNFGSEFGFILTHAAKVSADDYKDSGYDRGHLAPAADFKETKVFHLHDTLRTSQVDSLGEL